MSFAPFPRASFRELTLSVSVFLFCLFVLPLYAHAGFQVDTNTTLTTNLVAYYKTDESVTGATSSDAVGSRHLTNVSSTPFASGTISNVADGGASNSSRYLRNVSDNYGIDGGSMSISL